MDIIRGYSKVFDTSYGDFYIKHLDIYDSEEIDEKAEEYKNHAIKQGLPSSEERLKFLEEEGSWDQKKEGEVNDLEKMITNLKVTKSKLILKADIDNIQNQIDSSKKELQSLKIEKTQLVGFTSNVYASKKINEYYVFKTSFKDQDLKKPLFEKEQFEELQEKDIALLIKYYNSVSDKTEEENIKRIALSGFFLNNFYLCDDNPQIYYGKAVLDLTYSQNELFSWGRYFKSILSEMKNKPHPEVMDDPDKLIEIYNVGKNSEKARESSQNADATTVVGATKEDLERMGMQPPNPNGVNLAAEAAKKGGNLNMEDLIKLHGA